MFEIDRSTVCGGKTVYGAAVGILVLGTKFPRMPGDISFAPTWPFPVLYKVVLFLYRRWPLRTDDRRPNFDWRPRHAGLRTAQYRSPLQKCTRDTSMHARLDAAGRSGPVLQENLGTRRGRQLHWRQARGAQQGAPDNLLFRALTSSQGT